MKRIYRYLPILALLISGFTTLTAQDLPKLKQASNIVTGALPNGIQYYIAHNPNSDGYADYALVQKEALGEREAREALLSLPHFRDPRPYEFLAYKGVGYGSKGFVQAGEGSTIFRFEDVPTSDAAAADSTLMMILDLCTISSQEQAIVISGDVSADNIKGKLSILSMMVPQLALTDTTDHYQFESTDYLTLVSLKSNTPSTATITAEYAIARTPREYLNTVQTYVNNMLYRELSILIERRLKRAFRAVSIPVADIVSRYSDASSGGGDESFLVSFHVDQDDIEAATKILSEVLSDIDLRGVQSDELDAVNRAYVSGLRRQITTQGLTNADYIDRCISAYLYGTSLAAPDDELSYMGSKVMTGEASATIFSRFASAVLDPQKNLTLTYEVPSGVVDDELLTSTFSDAWSFGILSHTLTSVKPVSGDTLYRHSLPKLPKVKLKSEEPEPISGGKILTFSNGLRVVYKQTQGAGDFEYALFVRGGYPYIKGLRSGEGAFVSDVFASQKIGDIDQYDMADILEEEGIELRREVGISDMRVYGSAPTGRLDFVLGMLATMGLERETEPCDPVYFKKCEAVHLEEAGVEAAVDSIMRPDYVFSQYRYIDNLSTKLPAKVAEFTQARLSSLGDGMLVIIGPIEQDVLVKSLSRTLGAFEMGRTNPARPQGAYHLGSGWTTYHAPSDTKTDAQAYICMSSITPVTMERYVALEIACGIMNKALTSALSTSGIYADVEDNVEIFPQERISMHISCHGTASSGLPAGMSPISPDQAVVILREAIDAAASAPISEDDLRICKDILTKYIVRSQAQPSHIRDAVITRYSEGKDFTTRYLDVIKSLSEQDIRDVLTILSEGCKVEYIVY